MRWNKNCRIGRNYKSSSLADNVRNVAYKQLNKKFGVMGNKYYVQGA